MPIVDVVNFNADASCLPSAKWLKCLEDGEHSLFMQMLKNYVRFDRKVNLGLVGATIKDIAFFNPEVIDYINDHQDVFQLLARPFTHDNPLLRLPDGFRYNLEKGLRCIHDYFSNVSSYYYLSPEIMLTGEQIHILEEFDIQCIFLHKNRYNKNIRRHIPDTPFMLHGVLSTQMRCIPFAAGELESKYLSALHGVTTTDIWCEEVNRKSASDLYLWRDGESCLLWPLGIDHEATIFEAELIAGVNRKFLSEISLGEIPNTTKGDAVLRYFPLHSMKPWLNEMKLYWFVSRVRDIEKVVSSLPDSHRLFWLLIINSDILSSVEKHPPIIEVSENVFQVDSSNFLWDGVIPIRNKKQLILKRSERAGEGEDYLAYLELLMENKMTPDKICAIWRTSNEPHLKKGYARVCDEI